MSGSRGHHRDDLLEIAGTHGDGDRAAAQGLVEDGAPAGASWLLPDLTAELGKAELTAEAAVDGTRGLEALSQLRGDHAALCVLAWLCGRDELGVVRAIEPRLLWGHARSWAQLMLWRARDQQLSGGAVARQNRLPSFRWRGHEVAGLDSVLARLCAADAAEVQALLEWLTDAEVGSPFEDGLRHS